MTTDEEIKIIPIPLHLLNDDTSNSDNVTNYINAYYRTSIKALERAVNVNIYKSKSNHYKLFVWDEELNILKENSISSHNQRLLDGKPPVDQCLWQ